MEAFWDHVKSYHLSLYDALQTADSNFNQVLERSINLYSNITFLNPLQRHEMIMNDIKSYTNITILLNNGQIKTHTVLLSLIPYFKNLLIDCDYDNQIYINTSVQAMSIIINALYFSYIKLDNKNIIEVMRLMDFFTYDRYSSQIIYFLRHGMMVNLMDNAYKNGDVDKLLLFEMLLYHMEENPTVKTMIKHFKICEKYLLSFTHWPELFTEEQQLNAILLSKKYDMFNKSTIHPKIILKNLIETFPHTDCYYDIYNLDKRCFDINSGNYNYVIIKSYYPQVHYLMIKDFGFQYQIVVGTPYITITIHQSFNDIKIGSKIILSLDNLSMKDIYEIKGIHKKINDKLIEATRLRYLDGISYRLTLDKNIIHQNISAWYIKEVIEDVI